MRINQLFSLFALLSLSCCLVTLARAAEEADTRNLQTLRRNSTQNTNISLDESTNSTSRAQVSSFSLMDMDMCMMMQMYFYMSTDVTILFSGWNTADSSGLYVLSLIFVFVLCIIIEGLNFLRFNL